MAARLAGRGAARARFAARSRRTPAAGVNALRSLHDLRGAAGGGVRDGDERGGEPPSVVAELASGPPGWAQPDERARALPAAVDWAERSPARVPPLLASSAVRSRASSWSSGSARHALPAWPVQMPGAARRGLHSTAAPRADGGSAGKGSEPTAAPPAPTKAKESLLARAQQLPGRAKVFTAECAAQVREDPKVLIVWSKQGWGALKHFLHHTWTGCKLLGTDVRIASAIMVRVLQGRRLSRRERALLQRVVTDLFRLVPFSFFILVPAMEIFLPFALKLFPNMLPSQFADKEEVADQKKKRFKLRLETAKFLQECLHADVNRLRSKEDKDDGGMDLSEFVARARAGQPIPNEFIYEIAKHFKDEFLLDNLPRPQLVAMCSFLSIEGPFGPDLHVRFLLRRRMGQIINDDKDIFWEGVANLSDDEVVEACELRGIRTEDVPREVLAAMLSEWLELSTKRDVPLSLLVFSRAASLLHHSEQAKNLELVVSSLPEDVVDNLQLEEGDEKVSNERKLELLKEQEKLVAEELEQEQTAAEDIQKDKEKSKKSKNKKKKDKKDKQEKAEATAEDSVGGLASATAAAEAAAPATPFNEPVPEATVAAELSGVDEPQEQAEEEEEQAEQEEPLTATPDGRESLSPEQSSAIMEELLTLREEAEAHRRQVEDVSRLLSMLSTSSSITEEKKSLEELRETVNRLAPHRSPSIQLKGTSVREEIEDARLKVRRAPSPFQHSLLAVLCRLLELECCLSSRGSDHSDPL